MEGLGGFFPRKPPCRKVFWGFSPGNPLQGGFWAVRGVFPPETLLQRFFFLVQGGFPSEPPLQGGLGGFREGSPPGTPPAGVYVGGFRGVFPRTPPCTNPARPLLGRLGFGVFCGPARRFNSSGCVYELVPPEAAAPRALARISSGAPYGLPPSSRPPSSLPAGRCA